LLLCPEEPEISSPWPGLKMVLRLSDIMKSLQACRNLLKAIAFNVK